MSSKKVVYKDDLELEESKPLDVRLSDQLPNKVSDLHTTDVEKDKRESWSSHLDFILSCVGYCVGLGNVWRFPFLCYKNGGGAFLLPYLVMVAIGGLPMYFLELAVGQYHKKGVLGIWQRFPALKGVGYAVLVLTCWSNLYYPVVMAWALWYLFHSFRAVLPWSTCDNDWNSPYCVEISSRMTGGQACANATNSSAQLLFNSTSGDCDSTYSFKGNNSSQLVPSEIEFWNNNTLRISSDIEEAGEFHWQMALTYLLLWIGCYFCIWKGVKWSGKVVYVTALLPYVLLFVLLIRGATLPGAAEGIRYYLSPQLDRLADSQVWVDAASQVFFSTGVGYGVVVVMGSYNKFHKDFGRSAILIATINSLTSLMAGFTIFSVLGFLAHILGTTVNNVTASGPGLVFIVYPSALSQLPGAPIWACLFFTMVVFMGFDSMFCTLETFFSSIIDEFPMILRKRRELFIAISCLMSYLVGLSMMTQGGIYVFQLMEWYAGSRISLLVIVLSECVAFGWLYENGFYGRINEMIGHRPNKIPLLCWRFVIPAICISVTIFSFVQYTPVSYNGVTYPLWAEVLGWFLTLSSIVWIPIIAVAKFIQAKGTLRQSTVLRVKGTYSPGFTRMSCRTPGCRVNFVCERREYRRLSARTECVPDTAALIRARLREWNMRWNTQHFQALDEFFTVDGLMLPPASDIRRGRDDFAEFISGLITVNNRGTT